MKVLFIGFGNVGRTIARILTTEKPRFPGMSLLDDMLTVGIVTRRGGALLKPNGVDLRLALDEFEAGGCFSQRSSGYAEISGGEAARTLDYDVLVELSTLSIENRGEPAATHIRVALERKRHAVSANKGPIAFSYRELSNIAKHSERKLLFETTVMDGAPVFNLRESCLRGCVVTGVDGILNSTTNYILSRMEEGANFADAVIEAQKIGVAEADPRNDIDGWDAAAKVSALANVLLDADMNPFDVNRTGISGVSIEDIKMAAKSGGRLKLVCRAWREGTRVFGKVGIEQVPLNHHFSLVSGGGAVLRLHTDLMGPILIIQENPDLYDTAYGVLGDLITVRRSLAEQ